MLVKRYHFTKTVEYVKIVVGLSKTKTKMNSNIIKLSGIVFILAILFFVPKIAWATDFRSPEVKIFNTNTSNINRSFFAFPESFKGGASIAVCDLDGNGYEEIVVGAGFGGGPQVRTLDSHGQSKFTPGFFAYDNNFKGGVNVACGDLDADGYAEIVTAPKVNGGPHIRIFNRYGRPIFTLGFFAYDSGFKGGVNIAIGDIDGGGLKEIIVAPASSLEPKVKVFNRYGNQLDFDIFPFHPDFAGGVSLATANVDGGPEDELIVAVQSQDSAWVKVIKVGADQPPLGDFLAFPQEFKGGVNVAGGDIDHDGFDEVIVSANSGGGPHIRMFEAFGEPKSTNFFAYESEFRGGVNAASGDVNNNGYDEILTSPNRRIFTGTVTKIIVDLSEQRLWAYEGDYLLKTFLVSTGLPRTPTRPGDFRISQKIYSKLYSGPDYYLPNTLWNMRFDSSKLLHGAYWHNNFGHRMSHGCINIAYPNAEWLYNSTPMWTEVIVRQ